MRDESNVQTGIENGPVEGPQIPTFRPRMLISKMAYRALIGSPSTQSPLRGLVGIERVCCASFHTLLLTEQGVRGDRSASLAGDRRCHPGNSVRTLPMGSSDGDDP